MLDGFVDKIRHREDNWVKPQVSGRMVVVTKCIPVAHSTTQRFLNSLPNRL